MSEEERIRELIDDISNADIENAAGSVNDYKDEIVEAVNDYMESVKQDISDAFETLHDGIIRELELLRIDVDKADEYSDPKLIRALFITANDMLNSCIDVVNKCFGKKDDETV